MILTPVKMLSGVFCLLTPWLLAAVSGLGWGEEGRARVTRDYLGNTGTVDTELRAMAQRSRDADKILLLIINTHILLSSNMAS